MIALRRPAEFKSALLVQRRHGGPRFVFRRERVDPFRNESSGTRVRFRPQRKSRDEVRLQLLHSATNILFHFFFLHLSPGI
jgi:hypothetical protein